MPDTGNSTAPLPYPFLRSEFFAALEQSGSTSAESGWQPLHLAEGDTFIPRYAKSHSRGEYVFDYSWADAYQRAGLPYHPKWLTAIPFTPCGGPRWLGDDQRALALIGEALEEAVEQQLSSWHILFPQRSHLALLEGEQWLLRRGVQYHWQNRDYQEFADFTAQMNSRKRKMVNRERRMVADSGLQITLRYGEQIDAELWRQFHTLYQLTYLKRSGGRGYLNEPFFQQLGATMADQLGLVCAHDGGGRLIAASLFFYDESTLYGRYWGCLEEYDFLHFELCYYRGIELAIARGLSRFDAGAQGEHKIVRGFEPVETHSLHWLGEPNFRAAVADFLAREGAVIDDHLAAAAELLPYKQAG